MLIINPYFTPSGQTAATSLLENATWCWGAGQQPPKISSHSITPFDFYRKHVANNKPAILQNLCKDWKPLPTNWELIFNQVLGGIERVVQCNATPNGRGDAIIELTPDNKHSTSPQKVFCKPCIHEKLTLRELKSFLNREPQSDGKGILYLSQQNNSLLDSFPDFVQKKFAPSSIPFANECIGKNPDAVNIWIGDERSTSVVHRDSSYENFYCVLRGEKIFHLLPPCAAPFLLEQPYQNACYEFDHTSKIWNIKLEDKGEETPWIEVDIASKSAMNEEPFKFVQHLVMEVRVKEGECLVSRLLLLLLVLLDDGIRLI
jgi:jumonji domain-containing protein 7